MAHKWSEIREKMSPERRERNREKTAALLLAMDLAELRDNLELTQEEVASRLQISQSNVSRMEKRRDMLVSTLREVIEAFGGELHLMAEFPDGSVERTDPWRSDSSMKGRLRRGGTPFLPRHPITSWVAGSGRQQAGLPAPAACGGLRPNWPRAGGGADLSSLVERTAVIQQP